MADEKFLGDGVMALFIPVITGADHAGRAIDAGLAGPGELLVGRTAWDRALRGEAPDEHEIEIAGRTGTLPVVSMTVTGDRERASAA